MVYCQKCGIQNADQARFCSSCGANLAAEKRDIGKEWEHKCEEDCSKGPRGASIIWALIVIFIGLWILFELGLKNVAGMPDWVVDFQFWWIFPVLIGIAVIIAGLSMLAKRSR